MTILIAATPLVALTDGPCAQGVVAALAALALATAGRSIAAGEARHLTKLIVPIAIGMAVPAMWMAIQAAPMPVRGLAHPMWTSAEAALGRPLTGSISLDPGATLLAIGRYLTMVGVVVATAAVTVDRRRAEVVLLWLTAAAALAAGLVILRDLMHLSLARDGGDLAAARALIAGCALGVPLSAAAVGHMLERIERRRSTADKSLARLAPALAGSAAALFLCVVALVLAAPTPLLLIAGCGFAVVIGMAIIRRLGVRPWFGAAAAATVIIAIVGVVSTHFGGRGDLTVRYSDAPARSIAIAEAIMTDVAWTGSGAASYPALLPIYREVDDATPESSAPTAAAEVSVDLGKPALWAIVAMLVLAVGHLLRGALSRGRDSFYPIAVMSSTIVVTLEAFSDSTGLATSVGLLACAAFGLGISQSASRTVQ